MGAAHEDVSHLELGDTRYLWKSRDNGSYVAWVEGETGAGWRG